jgi:transposase
MNQKYVVELSCEERDQLEQMLSSGIAPVRTLKHAQILLKSDCGEKGAHWSYKKICEAFNVSSIVVTNVRKQYVKKGLDAALHRKKPDREYERCLDGEAEAHLIALACGKPPNGQERWTLRLLQKQMVQLTYVETVSHETIRTTLKKMNLNLG